MRYLLDTNICIYAIRSRSPEVAKKLQTLNAGDIGVSAVTAYELWCGVHKSEHPRKNAAALERFLAAVGVLPFDERDAEECGKLRARLEQQGTPIGPYDLQIAAQARLRALVLVTNDEREFRRVSGLTVENWANSPR